MLPMIRQDEKSEHAPKVTIFSQTKRKEIPLPNQEIRLFLKCKIAVFRERENNYRFRYFFLWKLYRTQAFTSEGEKHQVNPRTEPRRGLILELNLGDVF